MLENIGAVLVIAVIVEFIIDALKSIYNKEEKKINKPVIMSIVISLIITFNVNGVDIFEILGLDVNNEVISLIITALIISGGSNQVHNFFDQIKNYEKGEDINED